MTIIVSPTRDQLEELFATSARVALDQQAKNEMRTLAEARALLTRAIAPLMDVDAGVITPTAPPEAQFNYTHLCIEYVKEMEAGIIPRHAIGTPEWQHWMGRRLPVCTPTDAEYFFRSVGIVAHLQAIGLYQGGLPFSTVDLVMHQNTGVAVEMVLNAYYLRRYPTIRFRPIRFLTLFVHWDEVDREGVPRVSLDGYRFDGCGSKI